MVVPDLSAKENVFEVFISGATLDGTLEGDLATFVSLDFFEHETQATPVVTGTRCDNCKPRIIAGK